MAKEFEVTIIPSFQKEIGRIRDKKQVELILKSFKKIERMGMNCLKLLLVANKYALGEIKFKRPPYRLYVIVDQESEKYYLIRWDHKKDQQKVINELKYKLESAVHMGMKNIMDLFGQ